MRNMARELRWRAQYADGQIVKEFEYTGSPELGKLIETPWWALDLFRVISFSLEGSGIRVGFRADDGVIGVNGKGMELALEDRDGRIFPLTRRRDVVYKVVQYKEAYSAISRNGVRNGIEAYNVGWETEGQDDAFGNWYGRLVTRVPTNDGEPVSLYLRLRCSNGFVGVLRYRYDNRERPPVNTILRPGMLSEIVFHVMR